jgi:uncharacterized protein YjaG (DUF416 family)
MPIDISILKKLDFQKQLSFAYLTCERLYPNYLFFSNNFNFGDSATLRKAIDYVYTNLINTRQEKKVINQFVSEIEDNIPEPAEHDTVLASSALDASTALIETLNFLIDKNSSRLDDISTMATDSVDMYIQEIEKLDFNNDPLFQVKIDNHPLMIKEVAIQTGIIQYLETASTLDYEDITTLLDLQSNNSKGSLNL